MGFLKVVTSIALAIFFLIFLNNFMAIAFPSDSNTSFYSGDESYKKCESLQPNYDTNMDYDSAENKAAQDAYSKCIEEKSREVNDKAAIAAQYVWLRAIIMLLVLVGVSIFLFKKYPFYGGALIAGGLLFALSYPIFVRTGFSFDFMYGSGDVSASVKSQTQLIKMITSLLGVVGLTVADLFFFEKHHDNNATPLSNNFTQNQSTKQDSVYPNPPSDQEVGKAEEAKKDDAPQNK